jgi:hypothetical protein
MGLLDEGVMMMLLDEAVAMMLLGETGGGVG